ncbi:MAG: polysaccharide biosynthesis protein [Syntrophomonadaceae bacterium]|nr:polysaccharide biosynthesis protein [Syntrophomonadaceae bacterium]
MFRIIRILTLMFIDTILINLAVILALLLRFEADIPGQYIDAYLSLVPYITIITLVSLYVFRLYHRMWQYASLDELFGILKSVTTSILILVMLIYTIPLSHLPRSIYILAWLLMLILIGASRLGWRILRDLLIKESSLVAKKTLIIGAGDAGEMVIRELLNNTSLNLKPVGIVDDSKSKQYLTLHGIPVLGNRNDIPRIVDKYAIEEIILAIPSAKGKTVREIVAICRQTPAKLRIFQGTDDLLDRRHRLREIQLEDLLRREPVKMNLEEIALYLNDKTVLVSGAGGSIGSELCRQVCMHGIKKIILLDNNENALFEIDNEIKSIFSNVIIETELTDIKDKDKLEYSFSHHKPEVVFHAAAHKHVPMMEMHPGEAIKNNIIGTKNISEIADKNGVETFIFISTDKAVNPTSIMGATKRIAEMIVQEINTTSQTHFAAVRFGNVLGSRGSVIPIFKQQIEKGGPVTVTHPDMTRYFMTIPEAVQLVIQAGAMAEGGEIFVLDMGEPVKILDIANDLINLYNLIPEKDIAIQFTGIRPGEKLYEELFTAKEQMAATHNERIYITHKDNGDLIPILKTIDNLITDNNNLNGHDAETIIRNLLPEYQPGEKKTL